MKDKPPKDSPKKSPVDVIAPYERAKAAIVPLSLAVGRGLNPGGYTVDLVQPSGSKRELASGMGPHQLVAFLDGIVAATTFIKAGK